jgi:hypothetical protein
MTQQKRKSKEIKPKIEINRRETKGKKKPDLFAKFRDAEHPLDHIFSQHQVQEKKSSENHPGAPDSSSSEDTASDSGVSSSKSIQIDVSPTKNFTKVSNSLFKQALSDGMFRGQSKHTYDVLYQKTRGAVVPTRQIQLTKAELVKITGLEAKTIQRHISFLKSVGLVLVDVKAGDHKGATYEIVVPEEVTLPESTLPESSIVYPGIKYTREGGTKYTWVHQGNPLENKGLTESLILSLKQKRKIDDEAVAAVLALLDIGKGSRAGWRDLIELIKMEFEIASARTEGVSNAPAFLAEHLQRRLTGQRGSTERKKNKKPLEVRKRASGELDEIYKIESLSEEGRESTLKTFVSYIEKGQKSFLMSLQDTYTIEDWNWLLMQIKEKRNNSGEESDNRKNTK